MNALQNNTNNLSLKVATVAAKASTSSYLSMFYHLPSHAFSLDAIKETYNSDPPVFTHITKFNDSAEVVALRWNQMDVLDEISHITSNKRN